MIERLMVSVVMVMRGDVKSRASSTLIPEAPRTAILYKLPIPKQVTHSGIQRTGVLERTKSTDNDLLHSRPR